MNNKVAKLINIIYYLILIFIIIIGIIYRTEIWLYELGFFGDEGPLVVNIQTRNIFELILSAKEDIMSAPYCFLAFSKIIYHFFGFNETALRFTSYISGILSVLLIPFLCQKLFKFKEISLIFLPIFIFNKQLCYYSMQFKQYSMDVFCTLLILYLFLCFKDKITDKKSAILTGIFFGLTGYFSFPAIFIVIPMCMFFIFNFLKSKKWKEIIFISLPFIILLGLEYLLAFHDTLDSGILDSWSRYDNIFQSFQMFKEYLKYTFIFNIDKNISFALFISGILYLFIKERCLLFILSAPILINSISGYFGYYPCNVTRVILYSSPIIIIICLKIFDILGINIIKKNIILNSLVSLLIISIGIYLFIYFNSGKLTPLILNGNKCYFYICNSKEYVKKLETKTVLPDDIVYVDRQGEAAFNLYDKGLKYTKTNVIYQSVPDVFSISDKRDNIVNRISNINEIPKNSYIYFYNTKLYDYYDEMDKLEEWIKENTIILSKETDDIGDFIYVKKVK